MLSSRNSRLTLDISRGFNKTDKQPFQTGVLFKVKSFQNIAIAPDHIVLKKKSTKKAVLLKESNQFSSLNNLELDNHCPKLRYTTAIKCIQGCRYKNWHIINNDASVFIDHKRVDNPQIEYSGDKLHISVSAHQLEQAYNIISPILLSDTSPFYFWKVLDINEYIIGDRVSDGAQFTLYAYFTSNNSIFSNQYLALAKTTILDIETKLIEAKIVTGIKPLSDVSKQSWNFISYRNEFRSDREGRSEQLENLKKEYFFQSI